MTCRDFARKGALCAALLVAVGSGVFACGDAGGGPAVAEPLPRDTVRVEVEPRVPEPHVIDPGALPEPFATESTHSDPIVDPGETEVHLRAPPGFRIELWAGGLRGPRRALELDNGDLLVAESFGLRVSLLRDASGDGRPDVRYSIVEGETRPFGLVVHDGWLYAGFEDAVVRARFRVGDTQLSSDPEIVTRLTGGGHWTRDLVLSDDGETLFVGVGSQSNYNGKGNEPPRRALILAMDPDGSNERVYASGLRNPAALALHPITGSLWTAVSERDGLGDDLPPDFATSVREGGFYGWPYAYIGPHPEPRLAEQRPDLVAISLVPDVLLHPHFTPLGMAFYNGDQFPEEYRGDLFVASHGSYNRAKRIGYEVVRIPMDDTGHPGPGYTDFIDGWRGSGGTRRVTGRPTGLLELADGSLLVLDGGAGRLWRVSYDATGS